MRVCIIYRRIVVQRCVVIETEDGCCWACCVFVWLAVGGVCVRHDHSQPHAVPQRVHQTCRDRGPLHVWLQPHVQAHVLHSSVRWAASAPDSDPRIGRHPGRFLPAVPSLLLQRRESCGGPYRVGPGLWRGEPTTPGGCVLWAGLAPQARLPRLPHPRAHQGYIQRHQAPGQPGVPRWLHRWYRL